MNYQWKREQYYDPELSLEMGNQQYLMIKWDSNCQWIPFVV